MVSAIDFGYVNPEDKPCAGTLLLRPCKTNSLLDICVSKLQNANTVNTWNDKKSSTSAKTASARKSIETKASPERKCLYQHLFFLSWEVFLFWGTGDLKLCRWLRKDHLLGFLFFPLKFVKYARYINLTEFTTLTFLSHKDLITNLVHVLETKL